MLKKVDSKDEKLDSSQVNLEGFELEVLESFAGTLNSNPEWRSFCHRWISLALDGFRDFQHGRPLTFYVQLSPARVERIKWRLVRLAPFKVSQDFLWVAGSEQEIWDLLQVRASNYEKTDDFRVLKPQETGDVPPELFPGATAVERFDPEQFSKFKRNFTAHARKVILGLQAAITKMGYNLKRGEFPRRGDILRTEGDNKLFTILSEIYLKVPVAFAESGNFICGSWALDIDSPLSENVFELSDVKGYNSDQVAPCVSFRGNVLFATDCTGFSSLPNAKTLWLEPSVTKRRTTQQTIDEFLKALNR